MTITRILLLATTIVASINIANGDDFRADMKQKDMNHSGLNKSSRSIGGSFANSADNGLKDEYCSNDPNDSHPPCDEGFENDCKKDGGHMSGAQGWGGKTCFKSL
ncbi:MAG: hypothetical protein P8179_08600 [Candidatus Thiodiazotropha sp.]|jgi:hypothetical protein